jgi:hypothetical protein
VLQPAVLIFQLFQPPSLALGGRSKPANEGRLKTGQRS